MTNAIHTTKEFRTVGMLEILNEPEQSQASTGDMINYFYPNALKVHMCFLLPSIYFSVTKHSSYHYRKYAMSKNRSVPTAPTPYTYR